MSFFQRLPTRTAEDRGNAERGVEVVPHPPIEQIIVPLEGEDPWSWEGNSALFLTGRGAFVVRREAFYAYAAPATREDFRAAFGDTGREFAPERARWGVFKLAVRIPQRLLHEARSFLHAAWQRYGTEDILLLYFFHAEQRYALVHPQLRFSSVRDVGYACPPTPLEAVLFGSIHSHPCFPAFHSHKDDADIEGVPGLHIVLGDLDLADTSIVCVLSGAAGALHVSPEDVFDPSIGDSFRFPRQGSFPAEWLVRSPKLPQDPVEYAQGHGTEVHDVS